MPVLRTLSSVIRGFLSASPAWRPNSNNAVRAAVTKIKGLISELVSAVLHWPPSIVGVLSQIFGWIGVSTSLPPAYPVTAWKGGCWAGATRLSAPLSAALCRIYFEAQWGRKVNRDEMHRWQSEMQMKSCLKWNRQLCQSTQALVYSCGVNIDAGNLYACPWRGHTWVGWADEKKKIHENKHCGFFVVPSVLFFGWFPSKHVAAFPSAGGHCNYKRVKKTKKKTMMSNKLRGQLTHRKRQKSTQKK